MKSESINQSTSAKSKNSTALLHYLQNCMTRQRIERFETVLERRTRHLCVVLENMTKPHNTSAVLRSCDCFGVQDVHVIEQDCESKIDKEISLGSQKWLTVKMWQNQNSPTADCLNGLKENGYRIVAATPHEKQKSLYELPIDAPIALVFGSEKKGISPEALALADECITVPMFGFTESFNLSVCAALCLSALIRKLHHSEINWHLSEEEKETLRLLWAQRTVPNIESIERRFYATGFAE